MIMLDDSYTPRVKRRLNKHASSILIGGVFLTFSFLLYLSICKMPTDDTNYVLDHDDLDLQQERSPQKRSVIVPPKPHNAKLIIMVITGPENQERRQAIRDSWIHGQTDNPELFIQFVVGTINLLAPILQDLEEEQNLHADLLLLHNVVESYHGLTNKLLQSLRWFDKYVDFTYLLKVDDDSFVNIPSLLTELKTKPKEMLYWGFFDGRAHVKHDPRNPWMESNWILCDRYLPYALGGGYLITSDIVHYVATNSHLLKKYISEDVSLGVWLAPLNVKRIHEPRFDTEFRSRGCNNKYIITHKQTVSNMIEKAENLKLLGRLCKKETKTRLSYDYNWHGPPTECCIRNDSSIP